MNMVFLPGGCVDDVVATLIRGSASAVVTPGGAAATSALSFSNSSVHSTAAMGLELMCCLNLETDYTLSWTTSNTSSFQLLLNSLGQNNNAKMLEMLYLANRPFRVTSHVTVPMKLCRLIYFENIIPFLCFPEQERKRKACSHLALPQHIGLCTEKNNFKLVLWASGSCILPARATSCSS